MQKQASKFYSIFFIAAIFTVFLAQLFAPGLTVTSLPEKFLWRNALIEALNNARFQMGDRVFFQAIIGKEKWMYYTGDKSVEDYQKSLKISPRETRNSLQNLDLLDQLVGESGGKLFLFVAPDKQTVYPQYMPDEIPVAGGVSRFDRVLNYWMELGLAVELVDLRMPLIEASSTYQVYQKGDTHWNCIGAYYAYREIMDRIAKIYPETAPHPLTDYEIRSQDLMVRDIPRMLNISHLEEGWDLLPQFSPNRLVIKEQPLEHKGYVRIVENEQKDLPTALVIHDSFYTACFNVLFEQHFSKTYAIHYAFVEDYNDLIKEQQADIVIIETVERYLVTRLSYINSK